MSYTPQTDLWLERSRLDGMMLGAVRLLPSLPTLDRMSDFMCVFCNLYILDPIRRIVRQAVPSDTLN
jgi:hypothetical protein